MTEFKVGDKVKVVKRYKDVFEGEVNYEVNYVGGTGVIESISCCPERYYVVRFDELEAQRSYLFTPNYFAHELELLPPEKPIETFNDYQQKARRTVNNDQGNTERLANLSMGLAGETGELVDHIKKHLFHDHILDLKEVEKELGDILWYLTVLADELYLPLEGIAQANIDKLTKRYPEGFSTEASQNRPAEGGDK